MRELGLGFCGPLHLPGYSTTAREPRLHQTSLTSEAVETMPTAEPQPHCTAAFPGTNLMKQRIHIKFQIKFLHCDVAEVLFDGAGIGLAAGNTRTKIHTERGTTGERAVGTSFTTGPRTYPLCLFLGLAIAIPILIPFVLCRPKSYSEGPMPQRPCHLPRPPCVRLRLASTRYDALWTSSTR